MVSYLAQYYASNSTGADSNKTGAEPINIPEAEAKTTPFVAPTFSSLNIWYFTSRISSFFWILHRVSFPAFLYNILFAHFNKDKPLLLLEIF